MEEGNSRNGEESTFESEVPPLLTEAEIDRNKDFSDLKVELDFVTAHEDLYREYVYALLSIEPDLEVRRWVSRIRFDNVPTNTNLQLSVELTRKILERLPVGLVRVSDLTTINYDIYDRVPIPNYDESGFVDSAKPCTETLSIAEFREEAKKTGDARKYHPSRILIGNTLNGQMRPTQVPESVSKDPIAILHYQIHVLLHEFIHTVEQRFRCGRSTDTLIMKFPDGSETTFQDWRKALLDSMTYKEPLFTSRYAESYGNKIRVGMDEDDTALAEQITENFVAYYLGIVPNSHGSLSFAHFNCGNVHPTDQQDGKSIRFELMKQFASAAYIEKAK